MKREINREMESKEKKGTSHQYYKPKDTGVPGDRKTPPVMPSNP
jgi:hypothetical protein